MGSSIVKKLDKNLYLLKYTEDYGLDDFLKTGASNTLEVVKFVQNRFNLPEDEIRIADGEFACTTFNSFDENGNHLFARNFDYMEAPAIIVWTEPKNGYKSIAVTDTNMMLYGSKLLNKENSKSPVRLLATPYTCMDGLNEKGLSIAVLEIKTKATKQKTGKTPITTPLMIRTVLDKCATVQEAIDMFSKFDMHDPLFCNYHYQVVDASGNSVVIEYVNNEMRLVYPEDKLQYCMNFYLSKDGDNSKGFGYTRMRWINEEFAKLGNTLNEKQAMKLLQKCRLFYKHKRGYMITSLWSCVYNCNEKTMLIVGNMDYDHPYKFSVDCPF